jgi:hypothetical protein
MGRKNGWGCPSEQPKPGRERERYLEPHQLEHRRRWFTHSVFGRFGPRSAGIRPMGFQSLPCSIPSALRGPASSAARTSSPALSRLFHPGCSLAGAGDRCKAEIDFIRTLDQIPSSESRGRGDAKALGRRRSAGAPVYLVNFLLRIHLRLGLCFGPAWNYA